MRWLCFVACAACGTDPPQRTVPYAIVYKAADYERHIELDADDYATFATGQQPTRFTVTMRTFDRPGELAAIFIRTYDDGVWLSSSPSQGVIVDASPSIEPACDGCHDDNAEQLGMFTLPAAIDAPMRGAVAQIDCPEEGTTPCAPVVYRTLRY